MKFSFFEFSRKTSLKEKRFRTLRIALYVVVFFLILTNISFGLVFRSQSGSKSSENSDISKIYTTPSGEQYLSDNYSPGRISKELKFDSDFSRPYDFELNYSINDFYEMKLNVPSIVGMGYNSKKFDDIDVKKGRFIGGEDELVISESLKDGINKVRDIDIGDEIQVNCKIDNIYISKEYELVGIIEDRWISTYRDYEGMEIIVPLSFFKEIPKNLTLDDPEYSNQTYQVDIYHEIYTVSLPKKQLDLALMDLKGIGSYYVSSYEESSKFESEYKSYLFVSSTFLFILIMVVIGLSFLSSYLYLQKFSKEIGVLRTMGASTTRTTLFVLKENIFVVLISIVIGLIVSSISPAILLNVYSDAGLFEIIFLNYGLPALILIGAAFTPFPFVYHKISCKEVIQELRNE